MSRQIISFIQDHYQLVFFGQYLLSSDSHFDLIHTKFLTRILAHYSTRVIMELNINQVPNRGLTILNFEIACYNSVGPTFSKYLDIPIYLLSKSNSN